MGASASNTCEYDAFEVPTRIAIDAAIAGVNVLVLLALWCTYTGPCSRAPQTFASQHNNNGGRQGAAGAGYGAGAGVDLWAQKALRKRRGRGRGFMATLCPCFFAGHNYGLPPRDLTQFLASLGFAVSATPVSSGRMRVESCPLRVALTRHFPVYYNNMYSGGAVLCPVLFEGPHTNAV